MKQFLLIASFFMLACIQIDAQIYRVAQERRANRPSIWLITSFSESGLACEMIIEKRRATRSAIDYEGLLSPSEVGPP